MQPHDRLRAAVEERLKLAKVADGGWLAAANPERASVWELRGDTAYYGQIRITADYHASAPHVAANDPAFVIRAAERDLRVLERHQPVHMNPPVACAWCKTPSDAFSDVPWPCADVRDLAAVYAVDLTEGGQSSG